MKILLSVLFCAIALIVYSVIEKRLNQQACPVCGFSVSADAVNQSCPRCDALINPLESD
jgi:predicted Zn-ribbon and HTH transcriptional regulator